MLVYADSAATLIHDALSAYGDLGAIDEYDAKIGTPTVAEMQSYDVVVTWSDSQYFDEVAMGDNLADYVDAGGKVITSMFSNHPTWGLGGRFISENYSAMTGTGSVYSTSCLDTYDASHPIMNGVTEVCDYYRLTGTALTADSSVVANWADGQIFVAVKNNKPVVTLGGFFGQNQQYTGQMADVVYNAILWVSSKENETAKWSGPRTNFHVSELSGWTQCYKDAYGDSGASLADIKAACPGKNLMLACKQTDSNIITLAAQAPRVDVLFDTLGQNVPHNANGVGWYYNDNYSWGFALEGDAISLSPCDIQSGNGELRMCWHTGAGAMNGGWRCGSQTGLNSSTAWERVVYSADALPKILMVYADSSAATIHNELSAYGDLVVIDEYDARSATPTLAELQNYDVVITWSNNTYSDAVTLGNNLADYVDAGGKVINSMFSDVSGWSLSGRFVNENYHAMFGTEIASSTNCLGVYDSEHPIMNGITDVCDYYRLINSSLTPDSSAVARWADGEIFVAVKNSKPVVTLGAYLGSAQQYTGQMADVVHNAILWVNSKQNQAATWSGPRTNFHISELSGWTQCYRDNYGDSGTSLTDIQAACSGSNLMLACKQTDSNIITLAAHAPRADVLFDTLGNSTPHNANGVGWYYHGGTGYYSWGFALEGDAVYLNSCDTESGNDGLRMCWHTNTGNLIGGYRCGATTDLNSSTDWERIVLTN